MKYLKSLSLIIFLLFNLNCFAKEVQDISNTETLNFDTKNKENTTEEHDVPDYISNPKEHAEKFVDEASKTILTVLVFFGFILFCWFFGDAESPTRKGSLFQSKRREDNIIGSETNRWPHLRASNMHKRYR